jgi:hypothetical protein
MSATSPNPSIAAATSAPPVRLAWPPPGLERLHDALWPVVRAFTFGALLLVAPLLVAIGLDAPFWSLGAFGQGWFIPIITSVLAFVVLLGASIRLRALLRLAADGAALGYDAWLMAAVATDRTRDAGFVLQGARNFGALQEVERQRLISARIVAALAFLAAALWLPVGFMLAALLAMFDVVGTAGIWLLTLLPAAILMLAGTATHALAGTLTAAARKAAVPAATAGLEHEAQLWRTNAELIAQRSWPARSVQPRSFRWAARLVVVPAVVLLVPIAGVVASTALGPLLASIAIPKFSQTYARVAATAVLQPYRVAIDPGVSATDAGRALHNITLVGTTEARPLQQPPATTYATPWIPEPIDIEWLRNPATWAVDLFPRVRSGLTAEERSFLATVAAHPAHAEFRVLAAAAGADVAGTRWALPLPDTIAIFSLPIPRLGGMRLGAAAHIGKAAHELDSGNAAAAEQTVREVISAGLVMMEEAPTLIDALIGIVISSQGGLALEHLYRATDRTEEAERLRIARETAREAAESATRRSVVPGLGASLADMPHAVTDDRNLRALRWELFSTFNTVAPCLNLRRALLGPDRSYQEWISQAEASLVRSEGERQVFELARHGALGTRGGQAHICGMPLAGLRTMM